jgi:heme-degrading monooxygenase HmoA
VFARVSTYRGDPGQVDEGIDYARENILPRVKQVDGCEGVYYLVDRESGKALSITLWESEEAMRGKRGGSEPAAQRERSGRRRDGGERRALRGRHLLHTGLVREG